jgi:hypothetical protein
VDETPSAVSAARCSAVGLPALVVDDTGVHEVNHAHDGMICVPVVKIVVGYTHSLSASDADGQVPVRIDGSEASGLDVDPVFAELVAFVRAFARWDAKPRAMRCSSSPGSDGLGPNRGYVMLTMFFDRVMRMIAGWAGTDRW